MNATLVYRRFVIVRILAFLLNCFVLSEARAEGEDFPLLNIKIDSASAPCGVSEGGVVCKTRDNRLLWLADNNQLVRQIHTCTSRVIRLWDGFVWFGSGDVLFRWKEGMDQPVPAVSLGSKLLDFRFVSDRNLLVVTQRKVLKFVISPSLDKFQNLSSHELPDSSSSGYLSEPDDTGGVVFAGFWMLVGIDKDGAVTWHRSGGLEATGPPLIRGDRIITCWISGKVTCVSRNGDPVWEKELFNGMKSSGLLIDQARLLVGGNDHLELIALADGHSLRNYGVGSGVESGPYQIGRDVVIVTKGGDVSKVDVESGALSVVVKSQGRSSGILIRLNGEICRVVDKVGMVVSKL